MDDDPGLAVPADVLAIDPERMRSLGYAMVDRTIEHLLGLDHERLTYRYQGRDFRLTDVSGSVVQDLLA